MVMGEEIAKAKFDNIFDTMIKLSIIYIEVMHIS